MKSVLLFVPVFVAMFVVSNSQLDPVTKGLIAQITSYVDVTVDPCQDFYQYACGSFVKNNPVPANKTGTRYLYNPSFTNIAKKNDMILEGLVNEQLPLLSDLYESCMENNSTVYSDLRKTVLNLRETILKMNFTEDSKQLESMIGYLQLIGVKAFIHFQEALPGLISPADVPFADFADMTEYYKEITRIQQDVYGLDYATALAAAELDVQVEQWLYPFTQSHNIGNAAVRNLDSTFNYTFSSLFKQMGITWPADFEVVLIAPEFFRNFSQITKVFSNEQIQQYLIMQVMVHSYVYTPVECWKAGLTPEEAQGRCGFIQSYSPTPLPPYTQDTVCKYFANQLMADYVGLLFSNMIVNADVISDIVGLTTGIQKAFGQSLVNLTWLDESSREQTINKLDHIIQIIGHPNRLDKYDGVFTDDSLQSNIWNIEAANKRWELNYINQSRTDGNFPPLIVNAFYDPSTNTINFPAGILESPMFSSSWAKLFQYARLGYVVGHENTHGFDNNGSHFGPNGEPVDIFDNSTRTLFNENANCIADLYSSFVAYKNGTADVHINGPQTLGENIADIGGVKNSLRAYWAFLKQNGIEFNDGALIPGLSTNQVFTLYQAQTWCSAINDEYLAFQVVSDVHSPPKWRVNGPMSQNPYFASSWSCAANTPMNPTDRCNVW